MGYVLEFYVISLASLRDQLNAVDGYSISSVEREYLRKRRMDEQTWMDGRRCIGDLLHGEADVVSAEAKDPEREVLLGFARMTGTLLGTMDNASASAREFLGGVLGEHATEAHFREPRLGMLLTGRPFCGLAPQILPGWGWLTRDELSGLELEPNRKEIPSNPNVADWLDDLRSLLCAAQDSGADLFTIYT